MAQGYIITYSDGSINFTLAPYAANGPESPSDVALYRNATDARTSLVFTGKGYPDYGDRINENMLHMLEHFASDTEPVFPTGGQIWYDRSVTPPVPRVYNPKRHTNISTNISFVTFSGDHTTRFSSLDRIRIHDPSSLEYEEYLIVSVTFSSPNTEVEILSPVGTRTNWFVGGWDIIIIDHDGDIDVGGSQVTNLRSRTPGIDDPDLDEAVSFDFLQNYVAGLTGTIPVNLDDLADVTITGPLDDPHILSYNTTSSMWEDQLLGDEITAVGDITLGGTLDMGGRRIVNMLDPDDGNPGVNSMAVTVGYLNIKLAGGSTGVTELKELTDVESSLSPNLDDLFQFDGAEWTTYALADLISDISSGLPPYPSDYVPLSGTTYSGSPPQYMDVDAFIHYDPTSAYRSDLGDEGLLRGHLEDTTLISLDIADALYGVGSGGDDRVEYGAYEPTLGSRGQGAVQLSWQAGNSPLDPFIPGVLPSGTEDGVQFEFDVTEGRHLTIDPKTQDDGDRLLYERRIAEGTDIYPLLSLRTIFDELNQLLGFRSAIPYRTQIDAGTYARPSTETLNSNYIPGKNNLEIYLDGTKQTASIHNWQRATILASSSTGVTDFGLNQFNIGDNWFGIAGNAEERFLELRTLSQSITLKTVQFAITGADTGNDEFRISGDHTLVFNLVSSITVSGSTGNDGSYTISSVSYNGSPDETIVAVVGAVPSGVADGVLQSVFGTFTIDDASYYPSDLHTRVWVSPGFVIAGEPTSWLIEVDNDSNTNQLVWGGYPTGLSATERYGLRITINPGSIVREPIIHGHTGNMAQLVAKINEWSKNNGEDFSTYLEGGHWYFVSAHPGTGSDVDLSNATPADLTFSIIDCLTENGDKTPGVGIDEAFIVSGDQTTDFVAGLGLTVTGSTSNNGTYTISNVEYNTISAGNTAVYVGSNGEIPDLTDTTGTINLPSVPIFDEIVGGAAEANRFYFYEFDTATIGSWTKKTDIDTQITLSGDYDEIGMFGFESDTIEWGSAPSSGLVEYTIQPEPEINQ